MEGHAIADIKVNNAVPPHRPPHNPPPLHAQSSYNHYSAGDISSGPPSVRQAPEPFVDPAILSVGKRSSVAPTPNLPVAGPPQEAPATPIKPLSTAATAPLPPNASPFVGIAKERSIRKSSAATLSAPFSSLNIADAEVQDSDDTKTVEPTVRRASITKTRTGKPMDEPSTQPTPKNEEGNKRTRRGGKARKKEVAAQERRNGGDLQSSPDATRKT